MMKMCRAALVLVAALSLMAFGAVGCGDDDDENGGGGGGGSVTEAEFMAVCTPFIEECEDPDDDDMSPEEYCSASWGIHEQSGGSACQAAVADFYECMSASGCEGDCTQEVQAHSQACQG